MNKESGEWIARTRRMPSAGDGNSRNIVQWYSSGLLATVEVGVIPPSLFTHWRRAPEPHVNAWETAHDEYVIHSTGGPGVERPHENDVQRERDAWLAGAKWARDNPELAKEIPS